MQFKNAKTLRQQFEATCFHHGRIRLIEIFHDVISQPTLTTQFFLGHEPQLGLSGQQIDTNELWRAFKTTLQDEIQLLAFVGDRHHMHLLHMVQILQSLVDVKHWRELNHHFFGLLKKQIL